MTHRDLGAGLHAVHVAAQHVVWGDDDQARVVLVNAARELQAARSTEDPPEMRTASRRLLSLLSRLHATEVPR